MRIVRKAFTKSLKWQVPFLGHTSSNQREISGEAATITLGLSSILAAVMFLAPSPATAVMLSKNQGETQSQSQRREPLGSLSATGEVYVNEKPVPVESTVFVGDTVRTGVNSTAVFTMTGNGTLKIGPQTQVVLTGDPQYAADLKTGTVVIDSISGPSGIKVRTGGFVVVPAVRSRVTAAKIEAQPAGTFAVICLDGDISTIPLQGGSGQLLEAGQSVNISSQGALSAKRESVAGSSGADHHGPLKPQTTWTLLGLAGTGAGAAALVLGHGGGKPVSPSGP